MEDNHTPHALKWPNRILIISLAGVLLIVAALAGAMAVMAPFQRPGSLLKETGLFVCAGVAFTAVFVLLYLALSARGSVLLQDIPGSLESINSRVGDMNAVWRQQDNVRATTERIEQAVCIDHDLLQGLRQDLIRELLERQSLEGLLIAQLQREAEHLDEQITAGKNETKRLKSQMVLWRDSVIQIVEQIGVGSPADGPSASRGQKDILQVFARVLTPLGFEVVLPIPGERLDKRIHETPGQRDDTQPLSGRIASCSAPGFRWENEVIRKAQVHLAHPAEGDEDGPQEWSRTLVQKQAAAYIVSIPTDDGRSAAISGWKTYRIDESRDNDDIELVEQNNVV